MERVIVSYSEPDNPQVASMNFLDRPKFTWQVVVKGKLIPVLVRNFKSVAGSRALLSTTIDLEVLKAGCGALDADSFVLVATEAMSGRASVAVLTKSGLEIKYANRTCGSAEINALNLWRELNRGCTG